MSIVSEILISIEAVYASENQQSLISLNVVEGTTLESAIVKSGLLRLYPEIDLAINKVGVFSTVKSLDYLVKPGDRVEIYRPLLVDPKQARFERVAEKRKKSYK